MIAGLYDCFKHWAERGTVWVYADTHFKDAELASGVAGRPSDEEHLKIINSKVGRHDTLLLLGDVGDLEFAKRIKGYKVLIAGNHEAGLSNYKSVFQEVYGGPLIVAEKLILSHEPITGITWAHNLHGHVHSRNHKNDKYHTNCCSDATGYQLLNLNQWMKDGHLAPIESLHRGTISAATKKSRKRKYKLGEQKKG